ncbi:MAG: 6-phosphogluconolactonase [Candidatus Velthaea sp.]
MAAYDVTIVTDPAELAVRAADRFIAIIDAALAARADANVLLAGGSTPKAMNALLAAAPRRTQLDWSKLRFFFGDERCVPPEHSDSNFRMTRETLFDPLGIAPEQVLRIRGEDEPHHAADAYDEILAVALGPMPVFDLVYLGMGPDGHTASLFPGTLEQLDRQRLCVANFVPKFDAYRITVTPRVLNAAREIVITAGGMEKADALRAVLTGPYRPDLYPVQLVAPLTGRLHWFVDAAAASALPHDTPNAP